MNARRKVILIIGITLAALGTSAVLSARRAGERTFASRHAVYYCPMHPSYTSDRPGDCPICNMRLVKREADAASGATPAVRHEQKTAKDVCYLHQCPMAQQGKPCPMLVVAKEGEAVTCPVCGTHIAAPEAPASSTLRRAQGRPEHNRGAAGKRIVYWTDPMLPGYKSDTPGRSPMGMELVPVYESEESASGAGPAPEGYATVLVTPYKQQLIGVRTAPVARRALTKTIRTVGRVAYDPELYQTEQEYLQSLSGWLEALSIQADPQVVQRAQQLVESSRTRLRLLGLGEEMIQDLSAKSGPDRSLLLADGSGEVWVYASVYEFELPRISVGQTAMLELPAAPGAAFTGTVRAIDSVLDAATRSARVRVRVKDPDGALKPEMFVNVSIAVPLGETLAVPAEAVFNTGTKQIVFVAKGQGMFEPRDVTLGANADGSVEVIAGVVEGEPVVTSGNFLIDSESRLKGALQGMSPDEQDHAQ